MKFQRSLITASLASLTILVPGLPCGYAIRIPDGASTATTTSTTTTTTNPDLAAAAAGTRNLQRVIDLTDDPEQNDKDNKDGTFVVICWDDDQITFIDFVADFELTYTPFLCLHR